MTRHLIKTHVDDFDTIRLGYQTCVIQPNDRIRSTGDELWFAECGPDDQFTGAVIRTVVTFIVFGEIFGLQLAHELLSFP
jgi:hypothetical protein